MMKNKKSAGEKSSVFQQIKKEIRNNAFTYVVLGILLLVATYLRVYRTNIILGFYFDQGRDALVISDLIEKGKWFLIGPTTGIAGIFRGPFYYYLIAPAYWLGKGNPVFPSIFLELTTVIALGVLYYLGNLISDRRTGLIAVFIASFSYYIIYASRWLSNPTPMLLLSLLLFWMMILIQKGKTWAWIPLSFIAGSSLFHFGSSGEFFYFPALAVFALWQWGIFTRKTHLPKPSILILSVIVFIFTLAPLAVFDIRHEHILLNNIFKFFGTDQSFKLSFWEVASARLQFVSDTFYRKVFLDADPISQVLMLVALITGLIRLPRLFKNAHIKALLLLLVSPIIGLMFFQGNEGNIYDYYLTGYYLLFILFLAVCLTQILERKVIGGIFVVLFLFNSYRQNSIPTGRLIHNNLNEVTSIGLGNQRQAIDWVYKNASQKQFNVDVYVPPVIPYAYTYLFHWYDTTHRGVGLSEQQQPLLYTIYEVDPPHPERLEAWMKRQEGIGQVKEEVRFGGITVQKRVRFEQKNEKNTKISTRK